MALKIFLLYLLLAFLFSTSLTAATYTDAMGRKVVLHQSPQRIISLSPNVTEILFALDAEDKLVAVTDACTWPQAATDLPNIGSYADPSLEQMLLMRPDLVFAAADMNRPALVKRLESFHIPVYVVYPQTVEDTLQTILAIADITGRSAQANVIVKNFAARLQRIEQQTHGREPITALISVMLQPLVVAGPNTIVGDILRYAGGSNPVPAGSGSYPTWNLEALLKLDPEVIIISAHPGQPDPASWFDGWPQLQAVRQQRIFDIEADWIHRPGPRMILGIEALAKALHPDINLDD